MLKNIKHKLLILWVIPIIICMGVFLVQFQKDEIFAESLKEVLVQKVTEDFSLTILRQLAEQVYVRLGFKSPVFVTCPSHLKICFQLVLKSLIEMLVSIELMEQTQKL